MMEDVVKFDATEALKSVKEKIKDAFVSLIPDDQWNGMVKTEIDRYFIEAKEGYAERGMSSNFTKDVHSVLSEEVKGRVRKYLETNFNSVWNTNCVPVCDNKVSEFIEQNAGKVLQNMIGDFMRMALSNAGYNLR